MRIIDPDRPLLVDRAKRVIQMPLDYIVQWCMVKWGQSVNRFNARQSCFYTGMQFEELAEQIRVIAGGAVSGERETALQQLSFDLDVAGKQFKEGLFEGEITRCNHAELIDGQFDVHWVALCALFSTSTDPLTAIRHGAYTNADKMRDGKVIKDPLTGKVLKPADWQSPDFEPFTDKSIRD